MDFLPCLSMMTFLFFFFLEIIQVVSFERFFGFKSLIALLKAKN